MTSIASTVTTATGLRALATAPQAPAAKPGQPQLDEFQASSPDKHKAFFETAYNAVGVVDTVARTAGTAGQFMTVVGSLAGLAMPSLAGPLALVGGTYDVALGSSIGKQSAVNRNGMGALAGNLQLAQGLATYGAVLAPALGAPPIVGTVAAGLAGAVFVGRMGLKGYAKLQEGKKQDEAPKAPVEQPSPKPGEPYRAPEPGQVGSSRKFEKAFAFSQANDAFFRSVGGMGAFWTNVDVLRGQQPGNLFGVLGFVGGTYSLISGVSTARHSAINRNVDGTITGALQSVQGLATLAAGMGMGRPAAIVAAGAWAARSAYGIWSQIRAVSGKGESEAAAPTAPAAPPAAPEAPRSEEPAKA